MKTKLRALLIALLCVALAVGFSGCGMLKTIRENARIASERTILETPAEDALVGLFNDALAASMAAGVEVDESVSFHIGRPRLESENESAAADILGKCADALKNLIMEADPGSSSRELESGALADTLLGPVDAADVKAAAAKRNLVNVAVTDENEEEVTDAEGRVVTEQKINDNFAEITLSFHETETKTETDEDGSKKETVTVLPVSAELAQKYFGAAPAPDEIGKEFEKLSAYLRVDDYSVEYKACEITALIDLDAAVAHTVRYVKNFTVTAAVTGVGEFADMGKLTVTFDGSGETDYTFEFISED